MHTMISIESVAKYIYFYCMTMFASFTDLVEKRYPQYALASFLIKTFFFGRNVIVIGEIAIWRQVANLRIVSAYLAVLST